VTALHDGQPDPDPAPVGVDLAGADSLVGLARGHDRTERAGTGVSSSGRWAAIRRSPLVRRVTGYSAGSVIAAFTSELAFAGSYGWLHTGTTWASLIGFVGGAIPNYVLNRRWAWSDRRGRSRRSEIVLYFTVAILSFAVSALVTGGVERSARDLVGSRAVQAVAVDAAYLAVSGVFFVAKFVVYELVVFTKGPGARRGSGGRGRADATTS
jgi:putative flippase GtrA